MSNQQRGGRGRGGAGGEGRGGRGGTGRGGGGRGSSATSESRGGGQGGAGRGRGDADRGRGGGFRGGRGAPSGPLIFAATSSARVDARLSEADQDGLVRLFQSLAVKHELPLRPGYGKLGTAIVLRANFFPVKFPKTPIYDYRVEITPMKEQKRLRNRIFDLMEINPLCAPFRDHIAHDRSQRLVSSKELPQPFDLKVPYYDEGQAGPDSRSTVYEISIVWTAKLDPADLTKYLAGNPDFRDYDPLPLTSAMNLVLQMSPSRTGVRVGQNRFFFPNPAEIRNLGMGVDAWKGFYSSVRPAYKQLMLNVNVCMAPFYAPGNLAEALLAFNRRSYGGMLSLPDHFARHLKVTTSHLGYKRRKPLKRITDKSARNTSFPCEELGGKVTVEQYFKRKYNITLRHAHDLPVVDIGSKDKPNYVPAELCEIESGIPYGAELNDRETANMIKFACNRPRVNAEAIVNEGFPALGMSSNAPDRPLPGFGIEISAEMAIIPARELPPPRLTYKAGRPPNVKDGSWNILDVKFHRGGIIKSWWVMVVRDAAVGPDPFSGPQDPALKNLVQGFGNKCVSSGMTVPAGMPRLIVVNLPPPNQDPSRTGAIGQIRLLLQKNTQEARGKPDFILVLLAGRDKYIYPGIKRLGDVEMGLQTVHMLLPKALGDAKKQDQYFSNVALKVNTKLNGINHMLGSDSMNWLKKKKTMIVGMDVTHPGPRSKDGSPSIAAVVASVDDSFVQFPASLRIQEGRKEMVDDLTEMMVERLLVYERYNKSQLPERVFFYRDGVSEGQFDTVLHEELPLILEAFKKLNTEARGPYRPKLTIIVCGKRHHARFYPTTEAYADRNGNTRPGTVVDKGVTSVFNFDFYLQAHAGLQGTVRPTHYTVVYDENRLGADEVQQGTNTFSYLYARATKAVSLVPAAYYADLACERGRCYINDFLNLEDASSTAGSQKRGKVEKDEEKARVFNAAKVIWGEGIHKDLRETMFYI